MTWMFPTFFSFCPLLEYLLGVNGDNGTNELWGSALRRGICLHVEKMPPPPSPRMASTLLTLGISLMCWRCVFDPVAPL